MCNRSNIKMQCKLNWKIYLYGSETGLGISMHFKWEIGRVIKLETKL